MDKKDQSGSENNKGSWKTWKTQICSPLHLLCYLLGSFSASILSFSFLAKEVHFSDAFEASETGWFPIPSTTMIASSFSKHGNGIQTWSSSSAASLYWTNHRKLQKTLTILHKHAKHIFLMPASSSSCSSSSFLSRSSWGKNGCNLHAIRRNGSGIFQVYWSNLTYGMGSYGCLKIGHPKIPLVYHRFQAIHWNSSINSVVGSPPQCASGALVPAARPPKSFWELTYCCRRRIYHLYTYTIMINHIIYILSLVCWFTVLYMCKVCFMILSAYCCACVCMSCVCVFCVCFVCVRAFLCI